LMQALPIFGHLDELQVLVNQLPSKYEKVPVCVAKVKAEADAMASRQETLQLANANVTHQLEQAHVRIVITEQQLNAERANTAALKTRNQALEELKNEKESRERSLLIELENMRHQLSRAKERIIVFEQQLMVERANTAALQSENQALEEQKINKELISNVPPSLSIKMDTLLDLNLPCGWPITSSNLESIKSKEMVTVAILGMYDVGKSWFCNEFMRVNLATTGFNQRTDSLDFHFPTDGDNLIGIIDTPGSNEAIRCTQPDLVKKMEEANIDFPKDLNTDKEMQNYKILKNDAKILQDLKEKFIGELADVLFFICNKLSEKEQESIFKVIKHHQSRTEGRENDDEKISKPNSGIRKNALLYIIHNYKMLTEVEQVENQIQRDLKDSFIVKEVQLFANAKDKDCNNFMYQDQFGVCHLILAAKGSNAGKYYNSSTFAFLRGKVNHIENRHSTDVKQQFLEFCNRNIPDILKQEKIKLQLNTEGTALVKVSDCPNIILENLQYDEFGDFSVTTAFKPRCSVIHWIKESPDKDEQKRKEEVQVHMELLNSEFKAKIIKEGKYRYLHVFGNKYAPPHEGSGTVFVNQDIEKGKFDKKIRLARLELDLLSMKRVPEMQDTTVNGVVQWRFVFGFLDEPSA